VGIIAKLPWVNSEPSKPERETELGKLMREDIPERTLFEDKESIQPDILVAPRSIFRNGHRITASFGTYSGGTFKGKLHNGSDIVPKVYKKGDGVDYSVYPIGPGKVEKIGTEVDSEGNITGYGHYVVIRHTLSSGAIIYSRYAHLKEEPKLGPTITTEEPLGFMGDSGTAFGAHVHLEVYNDRAESKWYFKKAPEEMYDENREVTWDQKMRDGYYNPEEVINGDLGWQFKNPDAMEDVN
jgi:murein DD-endopeptidase MepM/ murein hydrolase activator NlpD